MKILILNEKYKERKLHGVRVRGEQSCRWKAHHSSVEGFVGIVRRLRPLLSDRSTQLPVYTLEGSFAPKAEDILILLPLRPTKASLFGSRVLAGPFLLSLREPFVFGLGSAPVRLYVSAVGATRASHFSFSFHYTKKKMNLPPIRTHSATSFC